MDVLECFHSYQNDVYRLAVSYTHNPHEAEDVCQSVFLKLLERDDLTPGKEKAWLLQVTANECRSLLRSCWWRRTVPLEEAAAAVGIPEDTTCCAIFALPPKYRVVIYLHYYEQYSAKEIGQLLKISTSAVTTRLARGREKLKAMLTEED